MNWLIILYTVLLFVVLTPAILVRLPPNRNKWTVAFVHGLIFAIVYHFTHDFVMRLSSGLVEGLEACTGTPVVKGSVCTSGETGNYCVSGNNVPATCANGTWE